MPHLPGIFSDIAIIVVFVWSRDRSYPCSCIFRTLMREGRSGEETFAYRANHGRLIAPLSMNLSRSHSRLRAVDEVQIASSVPSDVYARQSDVPGPLSPPAVVSSSDRHQARKVWSEVERCAGLEAFAFALSCNNPTSCMKPTAKPPRTLATFCISPPVCTGVEVQ